MGSEQPKFVVPSPGTPGTPATPGTPGMPGPTEAANGVPLKQSMAGLPNDPKTREQILRERYLKGLKKRKCAVCGNTARARCPFRSCKNCCSRAGNACSVHVLKPDRKAPEGTIVHPSFNAPPGGHAELASWQAPIGSSGFMRPGYSGPSPYSLPTPVRMGVDGTVTLDATAVANKYVPPGRQWAGSPVVEQQEFQRLKNLRVAAQEAIMTNAWRLQKVREHAAGEILAEDEAFDRYTLNSSLLEEVFALNASGLQGIDAEGQLLVKDGEVSVEGVETESGINNSLRDAMRARLSADPKRKEARRQKLKQVIDRAFKKLRSNDHELESVAEDEDMSQAGISGAGITEKRWEPKKSKARSEEGQQVLKTIEAFDNLLQKLNLIKSPEGIQACMDLYKNSLGGNLHYLIPNLYPREDPDACVGSGSTKKKFEDSLISPRATLLNYLSGAYLEANPAGQVVINNRNTGIKPTYQHKEKAWDSGVEKLERLHWHRKYLRGMGWWKVYAHDDTIRNMCLERANANTTILEL